MPGGNSPKKVAYNALATMFEEKSDEYQFFRKLILKNDGKYEKVEAIIEALPEEEQEGWHFNFLDCWMQARMAGMLTSEQAKKWKAEAEAKALPPSMRGDSMVPADIRIVNDKTVEQFAGKRVFVLCVRWSGSTKPHNWQEEVVSCVNQFRDWKKATESTNIENSVMFRHSVVGRKFHNPKVHQYLKGALGRLLHNGCQLHFFVQGLEGYGGKQSLYADLYQVFEKKSNNDNQAFIDSVKFDVSCFPIELAANPDTGDEAWPGNALDISDGTKGRQVITFGLKEYATANLSTASAPFQWLGKQWAARCTAREECNNPNLTLNQKRELGLATKRAEVSKKVHRNGDIYGRVMAFTSQ